MNKFKVGDRVLVRGTFCYGGDSIAVVATKSTSRLQFFLDDVEFDTAPQPLVVGDRVRLDTPQGRRGEVVHIRGDVAFVEWDAGYDYADARQPLTNLERA